MSKIEKKSEVGRKSSPSPGKAGKADKADKADKAGKGGARHKSGPHNAHDKKRDDWKDDFREADKDHNNKLTKSELKIPKAERKIYDRNDNGVVGRREFRIASHKLEKFDRLDKNDDGRVSKSEFLNRGGDRDGKPHGRPHRDADKKDGPKGDHKDHRPGGHKGHKGHKGPDGPGGDRPHRRGGDNDGPGKMRGRRVNLDNMPNVPTGGPDRPPVGQVDGDTDLVISSFNVLGSSHTVPGAEKPGMASGVARIRQAAQLLADHKVDVAGLQEFQGDQVKEFQRVAGDKFGVYPGLKLGRGPNQNSIVWRKDKFELVKADMIPIPYFNGKNMPMPVVRLRNKETGQEFYVGNFHNPAFKENERWRDEATRREVDLVNRLRQQTGLPVFITGDMNESDEYYQKMSGGPHGMHASWNANKRERKGIDWIFGSKDVTFTRHIRDTSAKVQRTTDHPMVVSHARIHQGR